MKMKAVVSMFLNLISTKDLSKALGAKLKVCSDYTDSKTQSVKQWADAKFKNLDHIVAGLRDSVKKIPEVQLEFKQYVSSLKTEYLDMEDRLANLETFSDKFTKWANNHAEAHRDADLKAAAKPKKKVAKKKPVKKAKKKRYPKATGR